MSSKKFKFVSPGVFLNEIDNSQLPKQADAVGPVIIGRSSRGPALKPVRIESFSEFIETFGQPMPGGQGVDVWREGNGYLAPAYAGYAVQAYLRNSSPVNFVRLLGVSDDNPTANAGEAGWYTSNSGSTPGAWALCVGEAFPLSASTKLTASVAAVFYTQPDSATERFTVQLRGSQLAKHEADAVHTTSSFCHIIKSAYSGSSPSWTAELVANSGSNSQVVERVAFNFDRTSSKFIRKVFNTNPTLTNTSITGLEGRKEYFLGESFENHVNESVLKNSTGATPFAVVMPLKSSTFDGADRRLTGGYREAVTGWFFAQDTGDPALFDARKMQKLFRFVALSAGENIQQEFKISIEDIRAPQKDGVNPYGSFTVSVRRASDSDNAPQHVERFTRCNLNPNSDDYIGKKIGDTFVEWSKSEKRYKHYGNYLNMSRLVRVEIDSDVDAGFVEPELLPFGVYGPPKPKDMTFDKTLGAAKVLTAANAAPDTAQFTLSDPKGNRTCFVIDTDGSTGATGLVIAKASWPAGTPVGTTQVVNVSLEDGNSKNNTCTQLIAAINATTTEVEITAAAVDGRTDQLSLQHDNAVQLGLVADEMDLRIEVNAAMSTQLGAVETIATGNRYNTSGANRILINSAASGIFNQPTAGEWATKSGTKNWLGHHGGSGTGGHGGDGTQTGHHDELLTGSTHSAMRVQWPELRQRVSGSDGSLADATKGYFGMQSSRNASTLRHDDSYSDVVAALPLAMEGEIETTSESDTDAMTKYSWVFTLDDIVLQGTNNDIAFHTSGSRNGKTAETYGDTAKVSYTNAKSYRDLLDLGYNSFTSPLYGGFDGVDIREADPFCNRELKVSSRPQDNYAFASVQRALNSVTDPEVVECNLMSMPGITDSVLTTAMVRVCESRADALAVIDLPDVFIPPHEATHTSFKSRIGTSVTQASADLSARGINSSYGCTYYPWVKIFDEVNGIQLWSPPSVIALGVFANTEKKNALWFAPAGFNRGGLTEGSAGIPVLNVTEKLSSKQRDTLYDAKINPIATFPSEGIVIFGQKTLQITASALDRINVRRLMIFVKKEVSRIASRLLFDQNVQTTWDRFVGQVSPFLERVKIGFGLTDFKVVLDKSTTTPDLIDRNIMYAKIFLKPARAIEFIAIDFVITNTGAAFED